MFKLDRLSRIGHVTLTFLLAFTVFFSDKFFDNSRLDSLEQRIGEIELTAVDRDELLEAFAEYTPPRQYGYNPVTAEMTEAIFTITGGNFTQLSTDSEVQAIVSDSVQSVPSVSMDQVVLLVHDSVSNERAARVSKDLVLSTAIIDTANNIDARLDTHNLVVKRGNDWDILEPGGNEEFLYQRKTVIPLSSLVTATTTGGTLVYSQDIDVLEDGDYFVFINALVSVDATTSDVIVEATLGGNNIDPNSIEIHRHEAKDIAGDSPTGAATSQKSPAISRQNITLTKGLTNLSIRVKSEVGGVESNFFSGLITLEKWQD